MATKFYICFYHDKRTFRSANQAYQEAKKMNEKEDNDCDQYRVFFCNATGGYHHTSITQAEMDRRQVTKEGGHGKRGHEHFESQVRRRKPNIRRVPKEARLRSR